MDDEDMYEDLREAVVAADSRMLDMVSIKEIVYADRFKKFKALDKEWQEHVSWNGTMQSYISSVSRLDTQSIMHDRPLMQSLIDHLRSMANRHDAKAPVSNGFRLTDPRRLGGYNLSVPDSGPLRREQSGSRRPFDIRRPQRKVILRHNRKLRFK